MVLVAAADGRVGRSRCFRGRPSRQRRCPRLRSPKNLESWRNCARLRSPTTRSRWLRCPCPRWTELGPGLNPSAFSETALLPSPPLTQAAGPLALLSRPPLTDAPSKRLRSPPPLALFPTPPLSDVRPANGPICLATAHRCMFSSWPYRLDRPRSCWARTRCFQPAEDRAVAAVGLRCAEHQIVRAGLRAWLLVIADDEVPRSVQRFGGARAVDELQVGPRDLDRRLTAHTGGNELDVREDRLQGVLFFFR